MANKKFKIVIDADIAHSAGMTDHPVSSSCRSFLNQVSLNGHNPVFCSSLSLEWKNHASGYSKKWLASMVASRKMIFIKNPIASTKEKLNLIETSDPHKTKLVKIALKDAHLIDLAKVAGKIVTSCDDNAKNAFCRIEEIADDIKIISWMHPIANQSDLSKLLTNENCQFYQFKLSHIPENL